MCGACGAERTSGADVVLGTAYARAVVARLSAAIDPRLVVRAQAGGWSVGRLGGASASCRTAAQLAEAIASRLPGARDPAAIARRILAAQPHRPLQTGRDAFPAGAVAPVTAGSALAPDRVIHGVLVAVVRAALTDPRGDAPGPSAGAILADDRGLWCLRC